MSYNDFMLDVSSKRVLVYTFFNRNNLTYKLVCRLKNNDIDVLFVRGKASLDMLVRQVTDGQYDYVLGLGDYLKTAKRIRIEGKFINRYGRQPILEGGDDFFKPTWKLPLTESIYISDKPSNGPCNRSAYLLARIIAANNLSTRLAFVHIPRSLSFDKAKEFLAGIDYTSVMV